MASRLQDVILRDTRANQPLATDVAPGTLYYVTDENVTERSSGAAWEDFSDSGGVVNTLDFLTHSDESVALPNSRQLLAGTGISFDDSVANQRTVSTGAIRRQITIVIDGAGSVITTGVKGFISVPFACTIKKWRLLSTDAAATAGDIKIDVWKDTYANYPPDNTDSITNGNEPAIPASGNAAESAALGGWLSVAISAGDILGFNVDSCTTITRASLTLEVE
jgi:hypothetical protein